MKNYLIITYMVIKKCILHVAHYIKRVRLCSMSIMSFTEEFVISGPKKQYPVVYNYLGKFLFESLKKQDPSHIFGEDISHNQTVTCGSLLRKSIKLSMALKKMSFTKKDIIVLMCENTLDSFVCFLALLFLGTPVHLVNFAYTVRELKHAFGISKPKCVICPKSSLESVITVKKELNCIETIVSINKVDNDLNGVIDIETLSNTMTEDLQDFQPIETLPNDTVFICLSSGTTGLPKCVELSNRNTSAMLDYILDERFTNVKSIDTTLTVVPMFHIYGVFIYVAAVVTSMKILTLESFKSQLYLESMQKYKVTKLFIVPPLMQYLTTNEKVNNFNLSSVRDIIVAGSPFGNSLYKEASEKFSTTTIRNGYGATEMCGFSSIVHTSKNGNSGGLINNLLLKVIDPETDKRLPAYKVGEIRFKGISVMKGYLNNPTETKNAIDEQGFYRTGDLGYYDENGLLFICGRLKELIKYKAFQVSPVELEGVILEHPAVSDCGVFGKSDSRVGELPTALVVLRDGFYVSKEEIIKFTAERISQEKHLHGGVLFVNKIPRNPTGKIIRTEVKKLYESINK